jgi:hypothetical protein
MLLYYGTFTFVVEAISVKITLVSPPTFRNHNRLIRLSDELLGRFLWAQKCLVWGMKWYMVRPRIKTWTASTVTFLRLSELDR